MAELCWVDTIAEANYLRITAGASSFNHSSSIHNSRVVVIFSNNKQIRSFFQKWPPLYSSPWRHSYRCHRLHKTRPEETDNGIYRSPNSVGNSLRYLIHKPSITHLFPRHIVTHWALAKPHNDIELGQHSLLIHGTNPLPKPMLTYHQCSRTVFTLDRIH